MNLGKKENSKLTKSNKHTICINSYYLTDPYGLQQLAKTGDYFKVVCAIVH